MTRPSAPSPSHKQQRGASETIPLASVVDIGDRPLEKGRADGENLNPPPFTYEVASAKLKKEHVFHGMDTSKMPTNRKSLRVRVIATMYEDLYNSFYPIAKRVRCKTSLERKMLVVLDPVLKSKGIPRAFNVTARRTLGKGRFNIKSVAGRPHMVLLGALPAILAGFPSKLGTCIDVPRMALTFRDFYLTYCEQNRHNSVLYQPTFSQFVNNMKDIWNIDLTCPQVAVPSPVPSPAPVPAPAPAPTLPVKGTHTRRTPPGGIKFAPILSPMSFPGRGMHPSQAPPQRHPPVARPTFMMPIAPTAMPMPMSHVMMELSEMRKTFMAAHHHIGISIFRIDQLQQALVHAGVPFTHASRNFPHPNVPKRTAQQAGISDENPAPVKRRVSDSREVDT